MRESSNWESSKVTEFTTPLGESMRSDIIPTELKS